jgi:hypothetical protein
MRRIYSKNKSIIKDPASFFAFFYYFIGEISIISYIYSFLKIKWILLVKNWLFLITLCLLFILSSFLSSFLESLMLYRFHWGFFVFYLYFLKTPHKFNFSSLLVLMLVMIVIEGVLVNTVVNAINLPNYTDRGVTHAIGTWQKVHSYGGNSSVAGVLLVVVLSITRSGLLLILSAPILVFIVASGSGILAYVSYLIYRLSFIKSVVLIFFLLSMYFSFIDDIGALASISPDYINFLIELKQEQIVSKFSNMSAIEMLIGTSSINDTGGDFLWLSFYVCHGFLGVALMCFIIFSNINKKNMFGILIILLMTSHYFVLFSLPGQFIFGYLLALKSNFKKETNREGMAELEKPTLNF